MSDDEAYRAACSLPEPPVPGWWKAMLALLLLVPAALALLRPEEGLAVLLLLPVLLLHEAGHVAALRGLGLGERRLLFLPFADSLLPAPSAPSASGLGTALLAGPLPGLALALGAQSAYRTSTDGLGGAFVAWLVLFNGANLVPAGAFDAGRLLDLLLLRRQAGPAAWLWLAPVAVLGWLAWDLGSPALLAVAGLALLGPLLHYPRLRQGRSLGPAPSDRQLFDSIEEPDAEGAARELRWLRAVLGGPALKWRALLAPHAAGLLLAAATLVLLTADTRAERQRIAERLVERFPSANWDELVEQWKQAPKEAQRRALLELQLRSLAEARLRQRVMRLQQALGEAQR